MNTASRPTRCRTASPRRRWTGSSASARLPDATYVVGTWQEADRLWEHYIECEPETLTPGLDSADLAEVALDLVAGELKRVKAIYGNEAIYASSGWASACR